MITARVADMDRELVTMSDAARTFLRVESARVESARVGRVQEISEEDDDDLPES